jgi:hypothetical protein
MICATKVRTAAWLLGALSSMFCACAQQGVKAAEQPERSDAGERSDAAPSPPSHAAASAAISEEFLADAADGFQTLVVGSWELPAASELYRCVRFTLPQDLTVGAFRSLGPIGTHHTLITVADDSTEPDGAADCDALTGGIHSVTAAGVGSNDVEMPESVGMALKAGQQLVLNLHLVNPADEPLRGQSGILVRQMAPEAVAQRAESLMAGTIKLELPAGQTTTQRGTCTMSGETTLFAVVPHMHALGVHLKVVAHSSVVGDVVLSDQPYDFGSQLTYLLDEHVPMHAGDKVDVDCTYANPTDHTVRFGNGSADEMCYAGLYRYPALGDIYVCIQ